MITTSCSSAFPSQSPRGTGGWKASPAEQHSQQDCQHSVFFLGLKLLSGKKDREQSMTSSTEMSRIVKTTLFTGVTHFYHLRAQVNCTWATALAQRPGYSIPSNFFRKELVNSPNILPSLKEGKKMQSTVHILTPPASGPCCRPAVGSCFAVPDSVPCLRERSQRAPRPARAPPPAHTEHKGCCTATPPQQGRQDCWEQTKARSVQSPLHFAMFGFCPTIPLDLGKRHLHYMRQFISFHCKSQQELYLLHSKIRKNICEIVFSSIQVLIISYIKVL